MSFYRASGTFQSPTIAVTPPFVGASRNVTLQLGSFSVKVGDLLFLTRSDEPPEREIAFWKPMTSSTWGPVFVRMTVVQDLFAPGIRVYDPPMTINAQPGSWTLSGDSCYYIPEFENTDTDMDIASDTASVGSTDTVSDIWFGEFPKMLSGSTTALDLEHANMLGVIVNPSGTVVLKHYFSGVCPGRCSEHLIVSGCPPVPEIWPAFSAACDLAMSCPVCMGADFAQVDLEWIKAMQGQPFEGNLWKRMWNGRVKWVDGKRRELGLDESGWEPFEEGETMELEELAGAISGIVLEH